MIGDQGRAFRQHQREVGVHDRAAVERAEIAAGILAQAERVLAADIERQLAFELALGGVEEADHAAEMVVMAVAQHHGVEQRWIDLEDRQVVVEHLGRVAEIDQHVPRLAVADCDSACIARPHSPLSAARGGASGVVLPPAPLDGEAATLFVRHELDHDVVGDDPHRQPVDLRHLAAERRCLRRPCAAARAAIMAETKPAPPEQRAPSEAGSAMQLQPPKSMVAIPSGRVFTAGQPDYAAAVAIQQ